MIARDRELIRRCLVHEPAAHDGEDADGDRTDRGIEARGLQAGERQAFLRDAGLLKNTTARARSWSHQWRPPKKSGRWSCRPAESRGRWYRTPPRPSPPRPSPPRPRTASTSQPRLRPHSARVIRSHRRWLPVPTSTIRPAAPNGTRRPANTPTPARQRHGGEFRHQGQEVQDQQIGQAEPPPFRIEPLINNGCQASPVAMPWRATISRTK